MEISKDDNNVLSSIFFQKQSWQNMYARYPELILIDATYKLNNLRIPMYILMVVDDNGESEIVALWLVVYEDKDTTSHLMDIFEKHNDTTNTKCIMADKDMTERKVLAEKIPNATLMICLFHTLRTFRREITTEKMGISAAQRITTLEIICKLVYAQNNEEYQKFYELLKQTELEKMIHYFDDNWHGIKEQWVEGLKRESCHYLNSTNNRLESMNQKIKSVVSRYSSILNFFQELMKCLDSLALERDHRAAMVFKKCSVSLFLDNNCLSEYQKLLTPYAFSFVVKQFELSSNIKITETVVGDSCMTTIHSKGRNLITSLFQCDCGFFTAMELPCRHIFSLRKHTKMSLFEAKLCAVRWTCNYYQSSHRVFSSKVSNSADITVSSVNRLPTAKVLSQHEKYRKVLTIGQRLASIASCISTREFSYAMQCLEKIAKAWEQGQQVAIQIVDPGCQDDGDASSCISGNPCDKNVSNVDINLDHHDINDPPEYLEQHDINDPPVDLEQHNINDPPVDLEQHDINDPPEYLEQHDINDPPVDLEQHDINDPPEYLEQHDINDPPEYLEQHDINDPPVDLEQHDINDPPVDLEQHDINDPPEYLEQHDINDPPEYLEQHDINDPPGYLEQHDINDPPVDLEQHDINDPPVDLEQHDINDPPVNLEQHDVNDPPVDLEQHNINDPPVDLEQHDINDPLVSLHYHDMRDPSAKLDYHEINDSPADVDLKSIKLPPKIRKRGRPKGAGLTVIGLPQKKRCIDSDHPVKFLKKSIEEREKQILSWMLPDHLVTKALQTGVLEYEEVNCNSLEFSPSLLDENVNWASVQKFFTKEAWVKMTDLMVKLEEDPKWKCGACHKDLSLFESIVCESCLVWNHLKCVGLTAAPKRAVWFC